MVFQTIDLRYFPPEFVYGSKPDPRSDVYALGAILYEATTGSLPFGPGNELTLLRQIREGELVPPSERVPGYPRALEVVVLKALARMPDDRYPNAAALADALDAALDALPPLAADAIAEEVKHAVSMRTDPSTIP